MGREEGGGNTKYFSLELNLFKATLFFAIFKLICAENSANELGCIIAKLQGPATYMPNILYYLALIPFLQLFLWQRSVWICVPVLTSRLFHNPNSNGFLYQKKRSNTNRSEPHTQPNPANTLKKTTTAIMTRNGHLCI